MRVASANLLPVAAVPATTLAGVLRAVVDLFAAMNDATPIHIGERYLRMEGKPRRIVIVPDDGDVSGVLGIGEGARASITQTATVFLWGAETGDDLRRYDDADALLDRFVNVLVRVAPGRLDSAPVQRGKDTDILTFGEEYRLRFSYKRQIPTDVAVWSAALPTPEDPNPNPPPFDAPPGTPESTIAIDLTTSPKE